MSRFANVSSSVVLLPSSRHATFEAQISMGRRDSGWEAGESNSHAMAHPFDMEFRITAVGSRLVLRHAAVLSACAPAPPRACTPAPPARAPARLGIVPALAGSHVPGLVWLVLDF